MISRKSKKVLVAMSGGVDSSVAASILKKKGYDCTGIFLNFWSDPTIIEEERKNNCCSIESMNTARRVAQKLDMPFYVFNVREEFKRKVVDYFIDTYRMCMTPNPCVECNRHIKFGFMIKRMKQLGADYLATGHYARVRKKKGKYELLAGKDKTKDQSYFLYTLTQDKLKHILFPLGGKTKDEIKKTAAKMGFYETVNKKESQGVCFFPDKSHEDFLKRHFKKTVLKKGPILTTEGDKIGDHKGLQFFTVGQRKGIEIGGEKEPWYVVRLDYDNNALIVGKNRDVYQKTFHVHKLTFVTEELPDGIHKLDTRIRYRFPPQKAEVQKKGRKAKIEFRKPQRAITPGQSVVFYKRQKVLGGGIIE
jgi:tRNA-specific 2-thiouridylase